MNVGELFDTIAGCSYYGMEFKLILKLILKQNAEAMRAARTLVAALKQSDLLRSKDLIPTIES